MPSTHRSDGLSVMGWNDTVVPRYSVLKTSWRRRTSACPAIGSIARHGKADHHRTVVVHKLTISPVFAYRVVAGNETEVGTDGCQRRH
jgi:hypothetical protein